MPETNRKLSLELGIQTSDYEQGLKKAEQAQSRFVKKAKKDLQEAKTRTETLTQAKKSLTKRLKKLREQGKANSSEFKRLNVTLKKTNSDIKKQKELTKTLTVEYKKQITTQKKLTDQLKKSNEQKKKQAGILSKLKGSYLAIAGAIAGVVIALRRVGSLIKASTDQFITYETALQEVNTLYSGTGGLTDSTKEFIRSQSKMFGKSQQENLKAYYQIVSAGITDQTKANKVLEQANKAAIAGVTDLFTAVDGLTSALNAYKDENLTAKQAADAMFSAVKLGKTTFGELAGTMGQVLTLAQSADITFEEVMASATQLTLRGLSTAEAFTQLKGVIRTFLKPSAEAEEVMEELGLQLDANAIRAKGFAKVMQEISVAVDGDEKKLALLFGRIQD